MNSFNEIIKKTTQKDQAEKYNFKKRHLFCINNLID